MNGKRARYIYFGVLLVAAVVTGVLVYIGRTPFPSDFMRAWYEPWRSETVVHGVPTVPHKPVGHDVFRQIYPFKALSIDILRSWHMPLWNPYNGAGQPLFAAGVHAMLNPMNLALFVFDPATAWTILFVGQFVAIALTFVLYAGAIGLAALATLIACMLLLGSSFVIANSLFATFLYSYAGLPLLLWCIEMRIRNRRIGEVIFPLAVAWTVLTGFPQLTLYIFLVTVAYMIFRMRESTLNSWSSWLRFSGLWLLGLGMSMAQLAPMYELYKAAAITTESSAFIIRTFLMPVSHLLSVFVPNFFGNPATYNYWGYADYVETAGTIGSVAIFFALCSWGVREKRLSFPSVFFAGALGVSLLLVIRSSFTQWLYRLPIPVFTTGVPTRLLGMAAFSLAMLAGIGIHEYLTGKHAKVVRNNLFFVWSALVGIGIVAYYLQVTHVSCANPVITNCYTTALRNSLLELFVFTAVGLLVVALHVFRMHSRSIVLYGTACIVLVSGIYNAYKFVPLTKSDQMMPSYPLLSSLAKMKPERVGYRGTHLPTDLATQYRFYDTNYYNPLYISRYGELVSYVNTGDRRQGLSRSDVNVVSDATVSAELSSRRERFWDMTGTSILLTKISDALTLRDLVVWQDNIWRVTKRPSALPRAYIVTDVRSIPDPGLLLEELFSAHTDIRKTAFVEAPLSGIDVGSGIPGTVTVDSYEPNAVEMSVSSMTNSLLIVSDTYYPGWVASVDGKEASVYRANYAFRGIIIPKGAHKVRMYYQPDSVRLGFMASGVSIALWAIFLLPKSGKKSEKFL